MNQGKLIGFCIFFLIMFTVSVSAKEVDLVYFHGQGCPHCARLESFLEDLQNEYPELNVVDYEVYFNEENRQLFEDMAHAYDVEIQGVPMTFIDNKVIYGFGDPVAIELEQEVIRCSEEGCIYPLDRLDENGGNGITKKLTIPAVIGAAAVDAINPCAFAVLIILLTTILASGIKRKALFAGFAFTLSIFISYFLMGVGLYSAIQAADFTHTFLIVVATLAIIIGLFNLKDYLWYGKWFTMEVPMKWRPKLKSLLRSITSIPGAFLIGFVVSLFLLPCTSGPYIIILGLLAETTTRNSAVWWLLLYNLIFILPMLIITLAIYFGLTTTQKADEWREKRLKKLHLIAGIIILLLGIGMFIALGLGII